MFGGLIWGGLFAGVPYQDRTPEMQAAWDMHFMVAEGLLATRTQAVLIIVGGTSALAAGWRTDAELPRKWRKSAAHEDAWADIRQKLDALTADGWRGPNEMLLTSGVKIKRFTPSGAAEVGSPALERPPDGGDVELHHFHHGLPWRGRL